MEITELRFPANGLQADRYMQTFLWRAKKQGCKANDAKLTTDRSVASNVVQVGEDLYVICYHPGTFELYARLLEENQVLPWSVVAGVQNARSNKDYIFAWHAAAKKAKLTVKTQHKDVIGTEGGLEVILIGNRKTSPEVHGRWVIHADSERKVVFVKR